MPMNNLSSTPDPPSGSGKTTFTIRGENLDVNSKITAFQSATDILVSESVKTSKNEIVFKLRPSNPRTVIFMIDPEKEDCHSASVELHVVPSTFSLGCACVCGVCMRCVCVCVGGGGAH